MIRIRAMSLAVLALPISLYAQQKTAPVVDPATQSFKAFAGHYGGWLVMAFDSIPANKYSYRPTPPQQTVGYIAQHLENANYQLCALFSGDKYKMTAKDSLADSVKAKWSKDRLVARLKASLAYCDTAMARVTDAKIPDEVPVDPPGSGRTIGRARFLIAFVTDLAEHYSQIASYMRLNGMTPPSALPRPKP